MTSTDRHLLEAFARCVRERYADAQVWGFGSRVRGDNTGESDLDICVVLDLPVTRTVKDWIGDVAWEDRLRARPPRLRRRFRSRRV